MNPNHPTDLLPGFALGCLDRPESEQVRQHLHECAICQAEVAGFQNVIDVLAYETPEKPKRSKPRRTPRRPAPSTPVRWLAEVALSWPRLVPALLVTWLIGLVVLAVLSVTLWQRTLRVESAALRQPRLVEFQALSGASGASAAMLIENGAVRGLLMARGLPALNDNMHYQLWLIKNGKFTSGGVFTVSAQGDGRLEVMPANPLSQYESFAISIEPFGGSPWPTGSKVLRGNLRN